ncbi:MAG: ATP-binding protein [Caldimonas sp.]
MSQSLVLPGLRQRLKAVWSRAHGALEGEARQRFRQQQLVSVHRHVIRAAIINSVLAVVLANFLALRFGASTTQSWLAIKLGVSVIRVATGFIYFRSAGFRQREPLARAVTLALLALDGAVWGIGGAWCAFGPSEIASLSCAVLCSVALMATHGFSTMADASMAYVGPMLLPLAVAVAFRGDAIGLFVSLGTVLVLLQSIVTSVASDRRGRDVFLSALESERARLREAEHASELSAALREVERQAAVKSMFLGTMSHELRTPLHGILGLTQLMRKQTAGDAALQHRLGLVESSGTHLLGLIGSLLDISRIESGRLELHRANFDLAEELRILGDLYVVRCEGKGIGFSRSVQVATSCRVHGDPARLRQVLHNLLGNAVKFTKSGMVVFMVRQQGDQFSFEVRDSGPGIAPEHLTHIFEAFRQVDDSVTRPADGTGLGLTIAREIAQAMGGDVTVKSALGVGSQFVFTATLPQSVVAADALPTLTPTLPSLRDGYRVLLVEDNEVNALIATAHLTTFNASVIRAHDGGEALTLAFAHPRPDFVLMDIRMPVMDGPTATKEIRNIEGRIGITGIPIVALTASPTDDDKRACLDAGMDGFLAKPFTAEELLKAICLFASPVVCDQTHPLYEYARSLADGENEEWVGSALH